MWQEKPPSVVRHILGKVTRRLANRECLHCLIIQRPDVVRLAIVVPWPKLASSAVRLSNGRMPYRRLSR
jgi:hypothetical protein